jgi:hypothetical protein
MAGSLSVRKKNAANAMMAKRRRANEAATANAGKLGSGIASIPKRVVNYIKSSTPSSVGRDVKGIAKATYEAATEDPNAFIEDAIFSPLAAIRDFGDVRETARKLRAQGRDAEAEKMEAMAGTAVLSAVPILGRPAGVATRKAIKAAEKSAIKGATKKATKTFAVPMAPETSKPLMGLHNINERKLGMVQRLGGLPVPSIAVVNPEHKFEGFGDISLVAPKTLVTPKSGNPVYASDVYSARFPALSDDETKIFRGYTDNGRRYSPLTLANAVREMKGNPRNAENMNYGAGSVRAVVTPQFRSMGEMQGARDRIIPSSDFAPLKDEANDLLYALGEKFIPHSKFARASVLDFPEQLAEAARVGFRDLDYNYENLPPELLDEARAYLGYLRDMPTEYFEAKPQRGVGLEEFAGAIVPMDTSDEVMQLLQSKGITDVQRYDRDQTRGLPTRQEALNRFRVHRFAAGGSTTA